MQPKIILTFSVSKGNNGCYTCGCIVDGNYFVFEEQRICGKKVISKEEPEITESLCNIGNTEIVYFSFENNKHISGSICAMVKCSSFLFVFLRYSRNQVHHFLLGNVFPQCELLTNNAQ